MLGISFHGLVPAVVSQVILVQSYQIHFFLEGCYLHALMMMLGFDLHVPFLTEFTFHGLLGNVRSWCFCLYCVEDCILCSPW